MTPRHPIPTLALAFALALAPALARAEAADRGKPINYSADRGDLNYETKVGSLSGNVVLTQGTITIRADRINFKQNADNSMSATAIGNPVSFRQKRDGVDEYYEGFAQRAEYDGGKELLELYDRALLKKGSDEIRSNYISYNASTEVFKAEGRPDAPAVDTGPGARVRGVFQPKEGSAATPGAPGVPATPGKARTPPREPAKSGAAAKDLAPPALKAAGELPAK